MLPSHRCATFNRHTQGLQNKTPQALERLEKGSENTGSLPQLLNQAFQPKRLILLVTRDLHQPSSFRSSTSSMMQQGGQQSRTEALATAQQGRQESPAPQSFIVLSAT